MRPVAGRRIFTVGDVAYAWEDLVLAGCLWGDWPALQDRVRAGLACLKRLDDLEDPEDALSEDTIATAAEEFRYNRDLIAAEDIEAWLDRQGLTLAEWSDYLRRSLLVSEWADVLEKIERDYPVGDDEVESAIACEAICGGHASTLASRLAGRAAAYAWLGEETRDGASAEDLDAILTAVAAEVKTAAHPERLEHLARLELAWRRFAEHEATPEAIRAQIAARRLEWTRLAVRSAFLEDLPAAQEAALCVREDGRDLAEVATEAGAQLEEAEWYLEEVADGLRERLLAARVGELVGPVAVDDGFLLVSVLDKRMPALDDPEVRDRAEQALLAQAAEREIASRVRWHERL
jgi:parvulin-like peptidyl-prolyl isomerase